MHTRMVALALVVLLTAGCFGGGNGGSGDGASSTATSTSGSGTPAPGEAQVTIASTPGTPVVGQPVGFTATAKNLGSRAVETYSWTWGDGEKGTGAVTNHTYAKAGDYSVKLTAKLSDGKSLSASKALFIVNAGSVDGGGNTTTPDASPPAVPGVFSCGGATVNEPNDTFGTDDTLPRLAWAALKTGFRFAVVWSSETPTTGSLTYQVGASGAQTLTETVPSRVHLFVVDGVAEDSTICFTASMGGVTTVTHALRAANAMETYTDGAPHGTYVVNFLVLNNELGDLAEVEAGVARYADLLWDASDGWVRAGAVLVVSGDYLHHNVGWPTCYLAGGLPGICNNVFDVLVTLGASPQGAASTYLQGVRDRNAAIWMNLYHQALPGPLSLDDFGSVLAHEAGHYLFDMADLYGDNTVITSECFDASTGISLMAGSREATEFDDPATPCPNQPAGYKTSWESLQGQFTRVGDRPDGPLKGPEGNGGLFVTQTYVGP